jgi:uncharacterized membrane protein
VSGESQSGLEARMQKLSVVISVIGLGLMVFGFADMLIHGASFAMPGMAALSPKAIGQGGRISLSLASMSAGIVILSLLPVLRVLLALSLYVQKRQVLNLLVAFLVFIELLVSAGSGG